jgi:hypothetical protein
MKIKYIFIRFLYFMSYKSFDQKTVFWFMVRLGLQFQK